MASNRRLETDQDFSEAMEKHSAIRVFHDDHMVSAGGSISRFDEHVVVIQSTVSDIAYYRRDECEFFIMKSR